MSQLGQTLRHIPMEPRCCSAMAEFKGEKITRQTVIQRLAGLPFLHGPPHLFNGPVLACFDHTHP